MFKNRQNAWHTSMRSVQIVHNGTHTFNNKQWSRHNRISPFPVTLEPEIVAPLPYVAFSASSSCCALRIYIRCLDWCARELYRNRYLMNHHPLPDTAVTEHHRPKESLETIMLFGGDWKTAFKITSSSRTHLRCLSSIAAGCWITHQLISVRIAQPAF